MGIDNNKFQPIVRRVQNINILLSPINTIQPAKEAADKLLKQIDPNPRISDSEGRSFNNFFSHSNLLAQQQLDPNA